jgi:nucleoside-diphosphate-sugar epimerase
VKPREFEDVVLLDNLSSERYCSLFDLPAGVPFSFVEADVCTADLDRLFDGVDCVVHLAAITNATGSFEIHDQVERVNFEGTRRVADACARKGSRLLFLSTTSVYGKQTGSVDEDCPIEDLRPQSPYATSKLRAEQMLERLAAERGLQCFIGRFGTIYGTSIGMRFHTAINKFCWQACIGQPLTVWRTAMDQVRPYLHLTDAVRAIRFVLASDLFDNRVYNVVTENASVRQIVELIRREVADVEVQYVNTQIMNQLSYSVSAERFAQAGFTVEGSLSQGITQTLRLFRGVSHTRLGPGSSPVQAVQEEA